MLIFFPGEGEPVNGCDRDDTVSDCGSDQAMNDNTLDDSMDVPHQSNNESPLSSRNRHPVVSEHSPHSAMSMSGLMPRHLPQVINLVSLYKIFDS